MTRLQALLTLASLLTSVTVVGDGWAGPRKPKAPKPTSVPAPASTTDDAATFDRQAASAALSSVDLVKCKSTNAPRGEGHITVKFMPAGSAAEAVVDKGPMMGTPVAKCIATQFKKAKVPAFKGEVVQVGKSFRFE